MSNHFKAPTRVTGARELARRWGYSLVMLIKCYILIFVCDVGHFVFAFLPHHEVCFECLDVVNCIDRWGFLSIVLNILIS